MASQTRPPPSTFQQTSVFLVSSPSPSIHPSLTIPTIPAVELYGAAPNSSSQQLAVTSLQNLDNSTVVSWLTAIRSHESGSETWLQLTCLSSKQRKALSVLKDYPDGIILLWLDSARRLRSGNSHEPPVAYDRSSHETGRSIASSPTNTSQEWADLDHRSSTGSFGLPPPTHYFTSLSTPQSSSSPGCKFLEGRNEAPTSLSIDPSSVSVRHPHGCPFCNTPRAIGTCDGWKRHMKEHGTMFPCKKCEEQDTTGKPRSYTRKANLVKHLSESHGTSNENGSELAEKWRINIGRKYFSCGFCVSLFRNITDQLNHIDTSHFRFQQDISGWDINTVIRGLLLRQDVNHFWGQMFGIPCSRSNNITWDPSVAKGLQDRLELKNEKAEDLAVAAASQAIWPTGRYETVPTTECINQNMALHDGLLLNQPNDSLLQSNSESRSTSSPSERTTIPEASQTPSDALHWSDLSDTQSIISYEHYNLPQDQVNLRDSSKLDNYGQLAPKSGSIVPQLSSHGPARSSVPGVSYAIDEVWQQGAYSDPSTAIPNASSFTMALDPRASTECKHTTAASIDQIAGLSMRTGAQPLCICAKKQLSMDKLRRHYGAELDVDFDNVQHVMREERHTRSEKRQR